MEELKIQASLITKKKYLYTGIKRIIDLVVAIIGLCLLFPLFLIIAIVIKVEDSEGTILYSHMRLGEGGRMIPVYKFRSMYKNAEQMIESFTEEQKREYTENFKLKDDPRITKVGKFLRKTSLDELPQLVNVIKGEMAIVGPRPIVQAELEKYSGYEELFLSVKPGLTGMWQAFGRSDTTYQERVNLDVEYILNQSLILDFKIILYTIISVLKGKGAY